MNGRTALLTAIAVAALVPAAVHAKSGSVDSTDKSFLEKAATGGMLEVELGKLAQQKASSADVKTFGQRMVDDHSKANDRLKNVAQEHGVTLPGSLDETHQKTVDRLSALNGAAFDREYMKAMVEDHKEDVADFQKEAKRSGETPTQQFAAETLPTLKEHLQMAQDTETKLGGGPATHGGAGMGHAH